MLRKTQRDATAKHAGALNSECINPGDIDNKKSKLVLVVFSTPAMASEWSFYGSTRMATWYQTGDAAAFFNSHDNGNLNESDQELTWDLQSNARIGAKWQINL